MGYFQRLFVNTIVFVSVSMLAPSILHVDGILVALLASFVLSILNGLVRPFLLILSIPINLITLGLFTFVVNAIMLLMTASFMGSGFEFSGFGSALLVTLLMSFVNTVVSEHDAQKYY